MDQDIIIAAENLGKKYIIGHQQNERYNALRDVLARTFKNLVRSARDMIQGKALVAGDELEEFWALREINFAIRRGEVVGIIGRNGAGKSTLLKVLSRITEPSEGRVTLRGRVASLLEVGTGFHPELTGRENIFLNGAILGMTRAEIKQKFDEIVDFAGVEKFLDTPVKRYSSGMYVRLAFAVAAHLEPEILVVDEVLAVGDAEFQKKCLGKMKDVAGHGRTVLFVSHNMAAIQHLCDSAILLEKGTMIQKGYVQDVVAHYLSNRVHAQSVRIDLSQFDRIGKGEWKFQEFCITNDRGEITHPVVGGPCKFIMTVRGPKGKKGCFRAELLLSNALGTPLILFASDVAVRENLWLENPYHKLICHVDRLPLSEGQYLVTLHLGVDNVMQDRLQESFSIEVAPASYYGTSRNLPERWQGKTVLVDHHWTIEKYEPSSLESRSNISIQSPITDGFGEVG